MAEWVHNGACEAFSYGIPSIWATLPHTLPRLLCDGTITGEVGEEFSAGRMGDYTIVEAEDGGTGVIGPPFRFDASNIDEWKDIY